jgi:sec-independent protein translocase protein TatA
MRGASIFTAPQNGSHDSRPVMISCPRCGRSANLTMNIGLPEILVIFFILLLVFGTKRLAGLGRGLGQAIRGFKDEVKSDADKPN